MAENIVIQAMIQAVNADPSSVELRLHLATLLLEDVQHDEALKHAQVILASQPDQKQALQIAAKASRASGDLIKATAYENLLNLMGMSTAKNLIETAGIKEVEEPIRLNAIEAETDSEVVRESGRFEITEIDRPQVTLNDVKGLQSVKDRINLAFLGPLRNPELRKLYGKSLKGGMLLYGAPGCGKTFLARAVAGELGAKFINIGLTDVVDMWLGNSEKNLHEIFETARRNQPCVLFIDEIDALGRKRSLMRHSAGTTIINQLLSEMDGAQFDNEGVFIIGATNHPWDVDVALRRPGRLDRTVLVLPPDEPARAEIIGMKLQERPTKNVDAAWIAKNTSEYSGADMAYLVESAAEFAMSDSIKSGVVRPIQMDDFKKAMKQIKPSTRAWFETAKNHAVFANEGGAYDELIDYLRLKKIL